MPRTGIRGMVAALDRANAAMGTLIAATAGTDIDWTMVAAIGIRETGFRNIAERNGGLGRGIFQIDIGQNKVTESQAFDPTFAANWAANRLDTNMATLAAKFPNLDPTQLLQATAASWNLGVGGISGNPSTIDVGSPGNNYGSNILGLIDCFH